MLNNIMKLNFTQSQIQNILAKGHDPLFIQELKIHWIKQLKIISKKNRINDKRRN